MAKCNQLTPLPFKWLTKSKAKRRYSVCMQLQASHWAIYKASVTRRAIATGRKQMHRCCRCPEVRRLPYLVNVFVGVVTGLWCISAIDLHHKHADQSVISQHFVID